MLDLRMSRRSGAGRGHRQDRGALFGVDPVAHLDPMLVHVDERGNGDAFCLGVGLGDVDVAPDPAFAGVRGDRRLIQPEAAQGRL